MKKILDQLKRVWTTVVLKVKKVAFVRATKRMEDFPVKTEDVDRGLLVLRLGVGFFFLYHGLGIFFGFAPEGGIETFSASLASLGFPIPLAFAYAVAFLELFGGMTILLGFFTKPMAVLLAVVALVAFVTAHDFTPGISGGDVDILSFAMLLTLIFTGPGKISLAERWYREDMSIKSSPKKVAESVKVSEKEEKEEKQMAKEASVSALITQEEFKETIRDDHSKKTEEQTVNEMASEDVVAAFPEIFSDAYKAKEKAKKEPHHKTDHSALKEQS